MRYYITGTRRGLGAFLTNLPELNTGANRIVDNLDDCDIFINCKHDGFLQVDLLYEAESKGKKVISIGSAASDWIHGHKDVYKYGIEKAALRNANDQLYYVGSDVTCINFGYFDSERSADIDHPKMSLSQCWDTIKWVIDHPNRVKEITVCA